MSLPVVEIWTDGGCAPNPGPGGWGVVLRCRGQTRELSGSVRETTNNRMELTAACQALAALIRPCQVTLRADSQYVVRGITEWVPGWKKRGWQTRKKGDPEVKNRDLWEWLDLLNNTHQVTWLWVRGHDGLIENERCDVLATEARRAA